MSKLTIPQGYKMPLSNNELQRAIELIHEDFQRNLTLRQNLHREEALRRLREGLEKLS